MSSFNFFCIRRIYQIIIFCIKPQLIYAYVSIPIVVLYYETNIMPKYVLIDSIGESVPL